MMQIKTPISHDEISIVSFGVYGPAQITITKVHAPMLLALWGGRWVSHFHTQKALHNTWMALRNSNIPCDSGPGHNEDISEEIVTYLLMAGHERMKTS